MVSIIHDNIPNDIFNVPGFSVFVFLIFIKVFSAKYHFSFSLVELPKFLFINFTFYRFLMTVHSFYLLTTITKIDLHGTSVEFWLCEKLAHLFEGGQAFRSYFVLCSRRINVLHFRKLKDLVRGKPAYRFP
ncbi:MAG: hypothetical protein BWX72_00029 [Firmicutes bacterium ADurb.Bin080]|nr:MAG: hypothetical protein BWX72_00029 [Firmicutes bacterium ADurb.Bin080]